MRRKYTVFMSLSLLVCLGVYSRSRLKGETDRMLTVMQQHPSQEDIVQGVRQAQPNDTKETIENAKRRVFGEMLKQRYRQGEPSIAAGLRFTATNKVRFFIPARMDPWEIDRMVYALWNEGMAALNTDLEIDICETFIGMAPVKIGELRHLQGTKDTLKVVYTYSPQHYASTILP